MASHNITIALQERISDIDFYLYFVQICNCIISFLFLFLCFVFLYLM